MFSIYMSVFVGYKFLDVAYEKLPSLSSKETLIFQLTRFLVLKPFSMPLLYDPNGVQTIGDSMRELLQREIVLPSVLPCRALVLLAKKKRETLGFYFDSRDLMKIIITNNYHIS